MKNNFSSCYLCDTLLDRREVRSMEHIILNAIGGKLKSLDLLCKNCNSKIGDSADKELAEQLSLLSHVLQVKRDSGNIPPVKGFTDEEGNNYNLVDGYKPVLKEKPSFTLSEHDEAYMKFTIEASNRKEFNQAVKGFERRLGQSLNVTEETILKTKVAPPLLHIRFSIGEKSAHQSITKSAINFYIYKTQDKKSVEHLFPFILSQANSKCVYFYVTDEPTSAPDSNEVLHLLHLVGNPLEKLLYCYVEYFGCYQFVVILSENYAGNEIKETYAYDIVNQKEVEKNLNFTVKPDDLKQPKFYEGKYEIIGKRIQRVMNIADKLHVDRHVNKIVKPTIDAFQQKYEGQNVPYQDALGFAHELASKYLEAIIPFIETKMLRESKITLEGDGSSILP